MLDLTLEFLFCCPFMVYFCTSLERELVELHLDNCASNTTAAVNTHTEQLRPYLNNSSTRRLQAVTFHYKV
jgi:hypothetical protein